MFVQTLANISPSKDNIVNDNVRYIDWKRGGLYTFTIDDYDELIQNEKLFARKFGENVDMEIVNKLYEYVSNN